MPKARIDWMDAGRVKFEDDSFVFVQRRNKYYINSNGVPTSTKTTGAHVTEYTLNYTGKSYSFTYYNQKATSSYDIGYYDANGAFLGGIHSNGSQAYRTVTYTPPEGTVTVLVYGIYRSGQAQFNKYASMNSLQTVGIFAAEEIRVKADGDSVSQVVWPTTTKFYITSATVEYAFGQYYGGQSYPSTWALAANGSSSAYVTATVEERLGLTVVRTITNVILDAVSVEDKSRDYINGKLKDRFRVELFPNPGYSTPVDGHMVVRGNDWKTTESIGGWSTNAVFTYLGLANVTVSVSQHENVIVRTEYVNEIVIGYGITLTPQKLERYGGVVTASGTLKRARTPKYIWNSQGESFGNQETYDTAGLENISVNPSDDVQINTTNNTILFPQNTGQDEIVYVVSGYFSGNTYPGSNTVTVYGSDTGHTYSNLSVSATYGSDISAGGGGAYPVLSISIRQDNSYTLTGTANNGTTYCTLTSGARSTTVQISYSGNTGGYISAEPRGTTTGPRREVGTCQISVSKTMKNGTITASTSATAYQAANSVTIVDGSFTLTGLTVTPEINHTALSYSDGAYRLDTAAPTDIDIVVRASGSGTRTKYTYSSGVVIGGDNVTLNNEEVVPESVSVTVNGSPITVENQRFTASNAHITTPPKSYSISATFENTDVSTSLVQVADEKIDGEEKNYTVTLEEVSGTNTLSAAGGEVKVKAAAYYTTGKVWKSDGTSAEEYSVPTYDLEILTIVATQNVGYTRSTDSTTSTYIVFKFQHRDMKNNETTDPLVIYAKAGNYKDTSNSPLSYSVTNYEITTQTYREEGETTRSDPYSVDKDYGVLLTVNNYTSQETAASFRNATPTTYYVNAYHVRDFYQEVTTLMYEYHRYTSWTALHDDMEHKILVGTSTITAHEKISTSDVTGDGYSVSTADTWLTINQTNQTISIADQIDSEQGTQRRGGQVVAVNSLDLSANPASDTRVVWQEAYKKLVVSPTQHTFDWKDNPTIIINIRSFYTQFKVRQENTLCILSISQTGAEGSWVAVDANTNYGQTASVQQYYLRVTRKDINYDTYTKLSDITLLPTSTNVPQQIIRITISAYDGGLPND